MQKITPFLWFDANAEEAVEFYVSTFKDSEVGEISRYGEAGPGPVGQAMVVPFTLFGQKFLALNGGPHYTFNQAVSFMVNCDTQEEIDAYWAKLSEGGEPIQCGWIKDRFGLPWQITPTVLGELMTDPDPERARRVTQAMMGMVKLDIAGLQAAAEGDL